MSPSFRVAAAAATSATLLASTFFFATARPAHAQPRYDWGSAPAPTFPIDDESPFTVVICIHGVHVADARDSWGDFVLKVASGPLSRINDPILLKWGHDSRFQGSQTVGDPDDPIRGMSTMAWNATKKLAGTVGHLRLRFGKKVKITLLCHSQGTVIALAALADGLEVDNVVFLGSPLGYRTIAKAENNTRIDLALNNIAENFVNLASDEDWIVKRLPPDIMPGNNKGIGHFGLPSRIPGIQQSIPLNGSVIVPRPATAPSAVDRDEAARDKTSQDFPTELSAFMTQAEWEQLKVSEDLPPEEPEEVTPLVIHNYVLPASDGVDHHGEDGWLRFKWLEAKKLSPEVAAFRQALQSARPLTGDEEWIISHIAIVSAGTPEEQRAFIQSMQNRVYAPPRR